MSQKFEQPPGSVVKTITFVCGCMADFPIKGNFENLGWHVVPCKNHNDQREEIAEWAEKVWAAHDRHVPTLTVNPLRTGDSAESAVSE